MQKGKTFEEAAKEFEDALIKVVTAFRNAIIKIWESIKIIVNKAVIENPKTAYQIFLDLKRQKGKKKEELNRYLKKGKW